MAIGERRPPPGCIHHSDRGIQYALAEYVFELKERGLQISMSAKGNLYEKDYASHSTSSRQSVTTSTAGRLRDSLTP
jgi:transposase InsO family protein